MKGTSQQSNNSAINSAQPQRKGFSELESALPPLDKDFLAFPQEEPLPPDTGIPPALYNPRETSLALASNKSTPVTQPVEREQMIPVVAHPSPQPTNPEGLRPGVPPDLSLVPPAQNQAPQDSSGPMELTPEDQEILNLVNLLNEKYKFHVRAWEMQSTRALRRLLSQAAMTQEMIEDIINGRDKAILLSQDWIPREDLNALERTLYQQTLDAERRAPPIITAQTNTGLALAPHPGHQPLVAMPTPEPQTLQHQAQETGYQGPTPPYPPQA
ncbi:hypothetical protein PTTG_29193 [Puccinia triticina 1-1 BBBD Race 1]|uniref:Uncharacterized protein n=1 Tax=Puccinia triticina (isolate 1-1 / race 1 (BBBD)) TaxID=630390 RepID=A0A180G7Z3_PUCT1|nr:hypothetical protein PTTG_29193 [Puccinia triticina 1-1 BBBD Race 1]